MPDRLEDLLKLKNIGRKVANTVLAEGFGKPAIAVDVYIHRMSNRWVLSGQKHHKKTEMTLTKVLPPEKWRDYNRPIVAFGQTICKPVKPRCWECSIRDWCDYYIIKDNEQKP